VLACVRELIIQKNWINVEVHGLNMRYLKTFKNSDFTHTFTNFDIALIGEDGDGPLKVARELHRVLKPGGVLTATTWAVCLTFARA
jgi:hypothetical protein